MGTWWNPTEAELLAKGGTRIYRVVVVYVRHKR